MKEGEKMLKIDRKRLAFLERIKPRTKNPNAMKIVRETIVLISQSVESLDRPLDNTLEPHTLLDAVSDPTVNVEEEALRAVQAQEVRNLLESAVRQRIITEKEELVLKLRWGFIDGKEHKDQDLAKMLGGGITRQGASKGERKARKKLKKFMESIV